MQGLHGKNSADVKLPSADSCKDNPLILPKFDIMSDEQFENYNLKGNFAC